MTALANATRERTHPPLNLFTFAPSVLILAEDRDDQTFLTEEFKRRGFTTFVADNPKTAFQLASHNRIDAILEDLDLPMEQRRTFIREIQSRDFGSPRLCTFRSTVGMRPVDAYRIGAAAVFGKPFHPRNLVARIRELLLPAEIRWRRVPAAPAAALILPSLSVKCDDLGTGGMLLHAAEREPLPVLFEGQSVALRSTIDAEPAFALEGTGIVRFVTRDHAGADAYGIEFSSLAERSIVPLLELIKASGPLPYIPVDVSRADLPQRLVRRILPAKSA